VNKVMWRRRKILKIFLALAALVVVFAAVAWFFPQQVLTVDSGPVTADVIVVMGGAWLERPQRAAELFKQDEAPKILVTGAGDCQLNREFLEKDGVPAAAITLESKSRTTRENARFSIPLLRQMKAQRVIIVTSWYHSRRALACFEHYAPDIQFYSRPSYYAYPKTEWRPKGISVYVKSEYLKLLGYWVCYGVCPF